MRKSDVIDHEVPPELLMRLPTEQDAIGNAIHAVTFVLDWETIKDSFLSVIYNPKLWCYHFIIHDAPEAVAEGGTDIDAYVKKHDLRLVRSIRTRDLRLDTAARLLMKSTIVGQTFIQVLRYLKGKLDK